MRVLVNELPMHARHHRRLEKWVICCIWSDLHITISAATFVPAFLFPACLTVYLRRDTSHIFLNPFFGDNFWKADWESWSQVHFYPCLLTYSRFLFSEDVADRNVTFGKLRVVFQLGQLFQRLHMNTIQPCGFEYKKIFHGVSSCSFTVSCPSPFQNVLIHLEVEALHSFEDQSKQVINSFSLSCIICHQIVSSIQQQTFTFPNFLL